MRFFSLSPRAGRILVAATALASTGAWAVAPQLTIAASNLPGTVTSTDTGTGAQPEMKFTYTATTARAADDNLFILNKPAGYTFTAKNNSELKALTTIKINSVVQTPGIFDTSIGAVWSGGIQIRLETGYSIAVGDVIEITIASGAITNPSSLGDVTWIWRTSDPSGNSSNYYEATITIEPPTTSTTSTTTTTLAPTTTLAATTTTVPGATTTVPGVTTSTAPTGTTLAPEPLEDKTLPNLAAGGSSFTIDGKDTPLVVTSSGGAVKATAGSFSLALTGSKGGSAVPLAIGAGQKLPAGSSLSVAGKGFKNGTTATLWLVNSKTLLGNATVNADGTVVLSGDLASSLAPGTYTVQVAGTGEDGKVRAVSLGFTITAPAGELTSTGARSDMWILVAIAMVMLGILATNGHIVRDEV